MFATIWRKLSHNKQFIEGAKIQRHHFDHLPFKNDISQLAKMFNLRLFVAKNSPHRAKYNSLKYTNDMANLHREVNYQQSTIMLKRGAIAIALILLGFALMREPNRDWKDNFDLKFMTKAYGTLDDASGEGASALDND